MRLRIRTRLTVWYVTLLAVMLTALGIFLVVRLRTDLTRAIDESLDAAATLARTYQGGPAEPPTLSAAALVGISAREAGTQVLSPSGNVVESAGESEAEHPLIDAQALGRALAGEEVRMTVRPEPDDDERYRVLATAFSGRPRRVIVLGSSLEDVDRSVEDLVQLLLLAGPAALAAAAGGGWWLARKALLPVDRMTREAGLIGVDRLHERIAVPQTTDELSRLARTLNTMLDRLEHGVESKRRFLADASHELRTPLAVMQSELDVSLRAEGLAPDAREVLESTHEEVERMSRTVEDLLTLARIDEGRMELLPEPVDLGELAANVVADMRPLAEARGVEVSVEANGYRANADRDRLEQVVRNLLDNALKYAGPGGTVQVRAWSAGGDVGLTVSDTGPGIPPDALPHVFDRFFRADRARSSRESGSGLGLAICREIIEAHRGRIWVESAADGATSFSLLLPALRQSE